MRINKKTIGLVSILSILVLSMTIPFTMAATTPPMAYVIDHAFEEEYWGILFDFVGLNVENDYTPGEYSGTTLNPIYGQGGDSIPDVDSKFYVTYTNIGNVQTLYLAMQNFSWDLGSYNASKYGCAPFQFLVKHFNPEGNPSSHVFVVNRFLGLMAYVDNKTDGYESIPDSSDQMFMGWAFYSGIHKHLLNELLESEGVPEYARINDSLQEEAIPIEIKNTTTSGETQYSYGMSYRNLFVAWQYLNATQGAGQTTNIDPGNFVAASIIKELNFTYVTTLKESSTSTSSVVETRVKYDIGNMSDLWVFSPIEQVIAPYLGGNYYNFYSSGGIAHYNATGNGIKNRLAGNETVEGFSLGVINTANIMTISLTSGVGSQNNFINSLGTVLGGTTIPIGNATNNAGGKPAYVIEFSSTKNYTLDGTKECESSTLVINKSKVITPMEFAGTFQFAYFLGGFIGNATGRSGPIAQLIMAYILSELSKISFYYITCFPEWSGGTIEQDPTFTAYSGTSSDSDRGIPGFELLMISIAGLMGLSYVVMKTRRKKTTHKT